MGPTVLIGKRSVAAIFYGWWRNPSSAESVAASLACAGGRSSTRSTQRWVGSWFEARWSSPVRGHASHRMRSQPLRRAAFLHIHQVEERHDVVAMTETGVLFLLLQACGSR